MRHVGMVALLAAGSIASALPDVAIVAAASNTTNPETNTRFTDARDKLVATGLFNSVSLFNATRFNPTGGTPTPAEFAQWDAVLVWSNDSFEDAVAMGTALADYVDGGGGVVVAVFSNTSLNVDRYLQGRWQTGNYIAIPQNGNYTQATGGLGQVLIPNHPIFNGVNSFVTSTGVTSQGQLFGGYRPVSTTLTAGSTKVATWNTGHTLVALAPNPRVVELGFHPVSNAVNAGYWDQTSDGARLMANALLFSMPCAGDATGDRVVNFADLNMVLSNFGSMGAGLPGDVNGDGAVNFADLNLVLSNFGVSCGP
ncbi:MAG: hypothetical protein AB7G17_13335 [Phycisphaerales bacterium]